MLTSSASNHLTWDAFHICIMMQSAGNIHTAFYKTGDKCACMCLWFPVYESAGKKKSFPWWLTVANCVCPWNKVEKTKTQRMLRGSINIKAKKTFKGHLLLIVRKKKKKTLAWHNYNKHVLITHLCKNTTINLTIMHFTKETYTVAFLKKKHYKLVWEKLWWGLHHASEF